MKNNLKINEGFERKLGINKERFIHNLKLVGRYNRNIIAQLNDAPNFESFIIDAFWWKKTPEKDLFWRAISKT